MCESWNLGLFCNILHHILHVTKYQSMIMAVRELWQVASRTKPAWWVECSRTRWGSVGCWGMALTSTCTSLEWAACFVPLKQQQMILVYFGFFFIFIQRYWQVNASKYYLPGDRLSANLVWKSQASLSRYSSDITTTILLHLQVNIAKSRF